MPDPVVLCAGWLRWLALLALFIGSAGCEGSEKGEGVPPSNQPPEEQLANRFMVSAANPRAVEVGVEVLRQGGNALDAAVAVQMALGFVEAPETGVGGGGFLLYRDGASGKMTVYDGREQAPRAATPERFTVMGLQLPLWGAVISGRSVGVPGLVAMLHQAHAEHGALAWADLIEPTISLAENGIPMPRRLCEQIANDYSLRLFRGTRHYFVRQWRQEEPRLINPQLAETLRSLAWQGPDSFYQGPVAEAMVAAARSRWPGRSDMSLEDLRDYRPEQRSPVCGQYRSWTLCGAPPPSSGGIAVLQILGMLAHFDLGAMEPNSVEAIHLVAEASRLAFADRSYYVGDPAFMAVPTEKLVDPDYLAGRAGLISPDRALPEPGPGEPEIRPVIEEASEIEEQETTGTSHFSIIDAEGNSVALTSSIEAPFGSRIMVDGFLLNNQLTDFTFRPRIGGYEIPNAVAPGKRPRSSMSPTIVMDETGDVRLVIGSRGGSRIIGYVVKALIGVLDWELSAQEAIALPNFVHRGAGLELEKGTVLAEKARALQALGHQVRVVELPSGLHGIERIATGWRGGADPRLDGVARGD